MFRTSRKNKISSNVQLNVSLKFKYSIDKFYSKNIKLSEPINSYEEIYKNVSILLNRIFNYQKSLRLLRVGGKWFNQNWYILPAINDFFTIVENIKNNSLFKNVIDKINCEFKKMIYRGTKLISEWFRY